MTLATHVVQPTTKLVRRLESAHLRLTIVHCLHISVDLYSFWCPNCGGNTPAKAKMQSHVQGLQKEKVKFDIIWLDIETCSGCWNDHASNVQFIRDLAEGAAAAGAKVGSTHSLPNVVQFDLAL